MTFRVVRSYLMMRRPGSSLLVRVTVEVSPLTTLTVWTVSVSAIQPSMPAVSRTSQPPGLSWVNWTAPPGPVWPDLVSPETMCLIWMVTPSSGSPVLLYFSTRRLP